MAGQLDNRGILVNCPSCGKTNRLAYGTLGKQTRCGECRTATLAPPNVPIEVPSDEAFVELIRTSALPVVVDFLAPWCGPCRMVAPELEKVARNAAGEMVVVKVNTEDLQDVGMRFSIRSIPTMAVFRDGREIGRTSGARPANDILAFVRQSLQGAHA
jgi:thioredoxin 2